MGSLGERLIAPINKAHIKSGVFSDYYCPIYGLGALWLVFLIEWPIKSWWWYALLVLVGVAVLEYTAGYLLELIFKKRWWDYRRQSKYNLRGYIAAENLLAFTILALIFRYVYEIFGGGLKNLVLENQALAGLIVGVGIGIFFNDLLRKISELGKTKKK